MDKFELCRNPRRLSLVKRQQSDERRARDQQRFGDLPLKENRCNNHCNAECYPNMDRTTREYDYCARD